MKKLNGVTRLIMPVIVLILLLSASGCTSGEKWDFTFGHRFFQLAQTTPEEWAEELRASYPEGAEDVSVRFGRVTVSCRNRSSRNEWRVCAGNMLYEMDQEFASVPGHCRIDYEYGVFTYLKFCLDTQTCEAVDEELIRQAKMWCLCGQILHAETKDADLVDVPVEIVDSHPVSLEYLIEYSNLGAGDLEGIDHEAFLQYHGVHTDNIGEFQRNWFSKMLDHYKFVLEEERWAETAVDYQYLFDQAEGRLSPDDLGSIDVIYYSYAEGTYYESVVIDYSTGKVYFSDDKIDDRDVIAHTGDGDREWLRDVLEQSGITEWQNEYDGTSEGTTGHFGMSFAFRLSDGRCVSYTADGVLGYKPSGMFLLYDALSGRYYTAD